MEFADSLTGRRLVNSAHASRDLLRLSTCMAISQPADPSRDAGTQASAKCRNCAWHEVLAVPCRAPWHAATSLPFLAGSAAATASHHSLQARRQKRAEEAACAAAMHAPSQSSKRICSHATQAEHQCTLHANHDLICFASLLVFKSFRGPCLLF